MGSVMFAQIINFQKKKELQHIQKKKTKQENVTYSKEGNKLAETSPTDAQAMDLLNTLKQLC